MALWTWRWRSVGIVIAWAVWHMVFPPGAHAAEPGVAVRLLVKLEPSVVIASGTEPNSAAGDDVGLGWTVVEVPAGDEAKVLAQLRDNPTVLEATPDYLIEPTFSPNDPAFAGDELWNLRQIGADLAWEFSQGEDVVVAVVDSGVNAQHPDLRDRLVPGHNFWEENSDTDDGCGHGTHVAGIVAAAGNNGAGGLGVAFQAKIMPVKVMGDGCTGTYSRLMQGILYALDNGADVIVITSGGKFDHEGLHDALKQARDRGVLVVVSAGNGGDDEPFYPGSYEESFTVSGTKQDDLIYTRSSFGTQVDISAPANHIYSTYISEDGAPAYTYMSGTSMAAPHVAGLAALLLAMDPEMSLADLEAAITQTADDLGDPGKDVHFGYGRMNAWRALWAVSPAAGSVRPGHARIPVLRDLDTQAMSAEATAPGIILRWQLSSTAKDSTLVVYRSTAPEILSAVDIAESAGNGQAAGSYLDANVSPGMTYYYWLVATDRDVETAVSTMLTATAATTDTQSANPTAGASILLPLIQFSGG